MRMHIKLDEKDIAQIIAEKYKCDVEDVTVSAVQETKGYGLAEHEEYVCTAKVVLKEVQK